MQFATTSILTWVALGTIAGIFAMFFDHRHARWGLAVSIPLGVVGAVVGGLAGRALGLYSKLTASSSVLIASVGSVVLLSVFLIVAPRWLLRHPTGSSRDKGAAEV